MNTSADISPIETETQTAPTFGDYARAVRVRQWAKNALVFGGFIFAGKLRAPAPDLWASLSRAIFAFVCFCALSSIAYLINDWRDIEYDRQHPTKKKRPLASGRISTRTALLMILGLSFVAVGSAIGVLREPSAREFLGAAFAYLLVTQLYSFVLKNQVILDVLCLASGFVVRVVAGCVAIPVAISPWIVFCTFTLALFIALCKRRAELLEMGASARTTRGVLVQYTPALLDTFIAIAAGLTIVSYSLYTFNAPHNAALGALRDTPLLMATIPFVVYGVFRYLLLAHSSPVGGAPENMLRDRPLMINVALWILLVALLTAAGNYKP